MNFIDINNIFGNWIIRIHR